MALAKSRDWTEAEIQQAIAALKAEPGLWEKLENVERTTADFNDTEVGKAEWRILTKLHPECELLQKTQLYVAIREYRRSQLGLK